MVTDEIGECPWCKQTPTLKKHPTGLFYVSCRNQKCPVMPSMTLMFEHKRHAVSAWNAFESERLLEQMADALQGMICIAFQDGWREALTGRQLMLSTAEEAVAAYRQMKEGR